MDRNLILAFALSFAVLMLWSALVEPPPQEIPEGGVASPEVASSEFASEEMGLGEPPPAMAPDAPVMAPSEPAALSPSESAAVPAPKSRQEQVAERIVDHLHKNFHRPELDLTTLAAELQMSAGHLKQSLKKVKGKTFTDFLRDLRLEKAKEMLKTEKNMNITQISLASGFNSLEYFIFNFKKFNQGKTPSQFRGESA